MQDVYAITLIGFFIFMFGVALWASRRVNDAADFIVAGRGLSRTVVMGTLIATWFGAGSLTVSANLVADEGLVITGLEPFGVGFCLILAGWVYARRLWEAKVLTLADLIRNRFGSQAEKLQVIFNISYFGWIAVQLLAIGNIFEMVFGLDAALSIVIVTVILTVYTLLGGMWSVALTDVVQVSVLVVGLVMLTASVLLHVGDGSLWPGLEFLFSQTPAEKRVWIPTDTLANFNYWLGLFLVGALGNLASQDFVQRIFAAQSADIAASSSVYSGLIYIVLAMLPVFLGLAGPLLLPADQLDSVVTALTQQFLSPLMSVILILTLTAAITSTVDSALLGPASTFAQNFLRYRFGDRVSTLTLTRYCVVGVAACSAGLALSGTAAIDLLQSSYTLGIPPLVILTFALYQRETYPQPAVLTLVLGLIIWGYDMLRLLLPETVTNLFTEEWLPLPLTILLVSLFAYVVSHAYYSRRQQPFVAAPTESS
ncbi:MAG: sodium:solute symporter [Pseudomonadota bacterium]